MSEILFASPGQTIDAAILAGSSGVDAGNLDEHIAAIDCLNPSIIGKKFTLGQFKPYVILGPNANEQMCGADFRAVKAGYTALPLEAKKSINDLGADEALTLLQAVQQFKIDHIPEYGAVAHGLSIFSFGIF